MQFRERNDAAKKQKRGDFALPFVLYLLTPDEMLLRRILLLSILQLKSSPQKGRVFDPLITAFCWRQKSYLCFHTAQGCTSNTHHIRMCVLKEKTEAKKKRNFQCETKGLPELRLKRPLALKNLECQGSLAMWRIPTNFLS